VIHPGALGDLLLAIPALRALRRAGPDDGLVIAAQPRVAALLAALGVVDAGVPFDALGLDALFVAGIARPLHGRLRDARRIVSWFGSRDATYVRQLSALAPDVVIASSVADAGGLVWKHLVKTVGGDVVDETLREAARAPADLVARGRQGLVDAGWDGLAPLLLVHAGASSARKRWSLEGFGRLIREAVETFGLQPVLHEGPADAGVLAALRGALERRGEPRRALGIESLALRGPDLSVLAGALRHVRLYLGNDSGISHLAAAVGVPSVVLFAPENVVWHPWSRTARAVVVGMESRDADARVGDADVRVADADVRVTMAAVRDQLGTGNDCDRMRRGES
jgi:ADP-heptose:LPS heptosyltransferase